MKQIVNRKKYNTETAYLLAVHTNFFVRKYLEDLELWHKENDEPELPDFDFDDPNFPNGDEDDDQEDNQNPDDGDENNGTDLTEQDDEDDFEFLSLEKPVGSVKTLDVDFDFDKDDSEDKKEEEGGTTIPEEEEEPDFVFPDDAEEQEPEPIPREEAPDFEWPEPVKDVKISPLWTIERFYQKKSTGEYFLVIEGGDVTGYCKPTVVPFLNYNTVSRGELPFYDEGLALDWAVDHLSVEQVEKIFGEIEE